MTNPPDRRFVPAHQWRFSEWAEEYGEYDFASLLAEAATLGENEPFNRMAAIFVALVYLATDDPELSGKERAEAAKLADRILRDLWPVTAENPAARAQLVRAMDSTIERVERHTLYPEYARLIEFPHRPWGDDEGSSNG